MGTFVLLVAACGGDDSTGPDTLQSLSFSIDGGQFTASSAGATRSGGTVTLTGSTSSGGTLRNITITIQSAAAGSSAIGGASSPSIVYSETASGASTAKQWAAGPNSGSGTLVITELTSTKAAGTFTATLPPVTVTGALAAKILSVGTFNLKF